MLRQVLLQILLMFAISSMAAADTSSPTGQSETLPTQQSTSPVKLTSPFEISVQPMFGTNSEEARQVIGGTLTTRQVFEVIPVALRYRLNSADTLCLNAPYVWRSEELRFADASLKAFGSGIGDVGLSLERAIRQGRLSGWDGTLGLDLRLPTGKSVYDGLNENELPLGIGHYEVGTTARFGRIADPFVLNFGIGVSYTLPRTYDNRRIRPGFGFTVQSGIGYAINDRWVLIEQLEYSRRPNALLEGPTSLQAKLFDQAYITHGLAYNPPRGGNAYSLRISLGINSASTDCVISLAAER